MSCGRLEVFHLRLVYPNRTRLSGKFPSCFARFQTARHKIKHGIIRLGRILPCCHPISQRLRFAPLPRQSSIKLFPVTADSRQRLPAPNAPSPLPSAAHSFWSADSVAPTQNSLDSLPEITTLPHRFIQLLYLYSRIAVLSTVFFVFPKVF